jgi:D-serine deaminase-like pyridoxal phosphate-dependent protein
MISPALVVFRELVERNIDEMVRIAGDPRRLRPHCKTHKMAEVTQLELSRGIARHKAATFAEAEMLALAGARDILLAYNLVGPNIPRAVSFVSKFPDVNFSATADHPGPVAALGQAMSAAGNTIEVLLDVDTGQHRTGVPVGPPAAELYRLISRTAGLRPGGIHLYDGQNHQSDLNERRAAVLAAWDQVAGFRQRLTDEGLPVPRRLTTPPWNSAPAHACSTTRATARLSPICISPPPLCS